MKWEVNTKRYLKQTEVSSFIVTLNTFTCDTRKTKSIIHNKCLSLGVTQPVHVIWFNASVLDEVING